MKHTKQQINTYKMTDTELYIYSNDANFIGITIGCFLTITEQKFLREKAACDSVDELYNKMKQKLEKTVDLAIAMYKKWQLIQKANMDYDKQMMIGLIIGMIFTARVCRYYHMIRIII